jgi:hypothetical protein
MWPAAAQDLRPPGATPNLPLARPRQTFAPACQEQERHGRSDSNLSATEAKANDTVHLPRRLVRRWTPQNRNAAAVRCNGLFAGETLFSIVDARSVFLQGDRHNQPIFLRTIALGFAGIIFR